MGGLCLGWRFTQAILVIDLIVTSPSSLESRENLGAPVSPFGELSGVRSKRGTRTRNGTTPLGAVAAWEKRIITHSISTGSLRRHAGGAKILS